RAENRSEVDLGRTNDSATSDVWRRTESDGSFEPPPELCVVDEARRDVLDAKRAIDERRHLLLRATFGIFLGAPETSARVDEHQLRRRRGMRRREQRTHSRSAQLQDGEALASDFIGDSNRVVDPGLGEPSPLERSDARGARSTEVEPNVASER